MKYTLLPGPPMMVDGILYEPGDEIEVDDERAEAWAERLEGTVEPAKTKAAPAPEPEPEPVDPDNRAVEGDDDPTPRRGRK